MKRLMLRSPVAVTKAFVLSPLPAIATVWLCGVVASAATGDFHIVIALLLVPWTLLFGALLSAILEVIVVAPLVAGLRRYQWRWINRVSVAILGFATGALPVAAIVALSPTGGGTPFPSDSLLVAAFGLAGIVGAETFALIATEPVGD